MRLLAGIMQLQIYALAAVSALNNMQGRRYHKGITAHAAMNNTAAGRSAA